MHIYSYKVKRVGMVPAVINLWLMRLEKVHTQRGSVATPCGKAVELPLSWYWACW